MDVADMELTPEAVVTTITIEVDTVALSVDSAVAGTEVRIGSFRPLKEFISNYV